jgi:hypothetical protein
VDKLPMLAMGSTPYADEAKAVLAATRVSKGGGAVADDDDDEAEVVETDAAAVEDEDDVDSPARRTVGRGGGDGMSSSRAPVEVHDGYNIPFVVTGAALNGFARYAGVHLCTCVIVSAVVR